MVNQQANAALQQYNQQLNTAVAGHRNVGTSINSLNDSFNQFNQALNTTVLGISAMDVIKFGADLNRLGQQVNIASQVFTALAGGTENAADMLQLMQEKTGGVVDNLTLMAGASRLLQMGLADSSTEVAGLTEMAIKLGGALGMDANKAIEDFSLLLSNVSYLRLDQFGISAGAVRTRVRELAEAFPEMTREARFAQAVLEEGQDAMNNLGSAAGSASTALNRFETTVTNTFQAAGANINYATENFLRFLEVLGQLPAQQADAEQEMLNTQGQMAEMITNLLTAEGIQGNASPDFIAEYVRAAIAYAEEDPSVWQDLEGMNNEILHRLNDAGVQWDPDAMFGGQGAMNDQMRQWLFFVSAEQEAITHQQQVQLEFTTQMVEVYGQYAEMRRADDAANAQRVQSAQDMLDIEEMRAQNGRDIAMYTMEQRQAEEARLGALNGLSAQEFTAASDAGFFRQTPDGWEATQDYASQADAYHLQGQADEAQQQVDWMREVEEAREGSVFTEEDIQAAQEYADSIQGMADEATRMADALERASLSDIMGQGGGGRVGEISDSVIDQMRANGATDEQIAAFQQSSDLSTGRQTETSVAFQEQLVPALSEMALTDPQGAIDAMTNFNDVLTTMAEQGIDPDDVDAVGAFMDMLTEMQDSRAVLGESEPGEGGESAYDSNGGLFNAEEFVTGLTEAQDPAAEVATDMTTTADQSELFTANMELAAGHVSAVRSEIDTIVKQLAEITGKPNEILLIPRIDQHALHLQLANELAFFQIALR